MTKSRRPPVACLRFERWMDDGIGSAALGAQGDVLGVAEALTADTRATAAQLLAAHAARLQRHLRAHAAWPDSERPIDRASFMALAPAEQASTIRRLWQLVAASGWRPTSPDSMTH